MKELLDVICTFTCALLCKTSLLFLLFLVAGGGSAYIPTFILRHFPPELSVLFTWLQILNCYTTKSTTSEREIHIRQMYTALWHGTQLLLFTQLSPALNTFCMLKKFIFKYCGVKFYKEPPNRTRYRFHGMKKYCLYVSKGVRGRIQIQQRERNKYKIYFLNCTKYTCMVISFIVKMLYALLPYFFNTKGFNATQGFAFFIAWIFFLFCFHLMRDERILCSKTSLHIFLSINCSSFV